MIFFRDRSSRVQKDHAHGSCFGPEKPYGIGARLSGAPPVQVNQVKVEVK